MKNKTTILTFCAVLLFGILAVGVQAGIGDLVSNMLLGKSLQEKAKLQSYGLDNIDYQLQCVDICTLTLNKPNVFQDRKVTFDTTYQVLIKEAIEQVMNETDGSILVEGKLAVYETRNYTTVELQSIAKDKVNAEIGSALTHFEYTAPSVTNKLDVKGKVKV